MRSTLLVVSSEDRVNITETSTQFTVRIRPAINNARRVSLAWSIIPNTTYNVTSSNNTLYWFDAAAATATIAPGSYTATSLATAVAAAMTAAGSQAYTVTYSGTTYHYTISAGSNFTLRYDRARANTIFPTMGYRYFGDGGSSTSFEGNGAVALWDAPYYVIRVDKLASHVQTTQANSNFGAFIVQSSTAQNGDMISWSKGNNYNEISDINVCIDTFFVELRDHNGNLADLNSSDWSFGMIVDYMDGQSAGVPMEIPTALMATGTRPLGSTSGDAVGTLARAGGGDAIGALTRIRFDTLT